jgi:elongation factor Ts
MATITTEQIKELRENTGISVMQCKKALEEAEGDMEKAVILLKKKAGSIASKKAERTLKAGIISTYLHNNKKVGVMVELACESDFVAKNQEFLDLGYGIAMHVAAMSPAFLSEDQITDDDRKKVIELFEKEVAEMNKPEDIKKKMLEGKLQTYFGEQVLLSQKFIKNPDKSIQDIVNEATQKIGERIEIIRFVRYEAGKE